MWSFCIPAGAPGWAEGLLLTETSLELYRPSFTSAWSFFCLSPSSPVDPSLPTLSAAASPHWPVLHLSPFRPLHVQLKAVLILPHKPLHLVKASLQSIYQCKRSAIILSLSLFCSLSPGPLWPSLAPSHYLYVDCLFCGDHLSTSRGL